MSIPGIVQSNTRLAQNQGEKERARCLLHKYAGFRYPSNTAVKAHILPIPCTKTPALTVSGMLFHRIPLAYPFRFLPVLVALLQVQGPPSKTQSSPGNE